MLPDVSLRFHADLDFTDETHSPSYHCLICGTYLDSVIIANRETQAQERWVVEHDETSAEWVAVNPVAV